MREVLGDRYRIVSPIGHGGMGAVYEAIDERTQGKVALKVIDAADTISLERFRREARVAAALSHPYVVRVTDFQENAGEPAFLVMERVDGVSLRALVQRDGPLEPRRACAIAAQVLAGLSAGHAQGIVHRDVKPTNILVSATPAGDVAKIVDFGLARELDDPRRTVDLKAPTRADLTMRGEALGTLGYLAPEQLEGDAVGDAADVYAVGATLFYMLEGRRPYEGVDRTEYFERVLREDPPRLSGSDPKLAELVASAMARSPSKRFESAYAMIEALRPWLDPVMARNTLRKTLRADPVLRQRPPPPRRRSMVLAFVVGGLGAAGAVVVAAHSPAREIETVDSSIALPVAAAPPAEISAVEPVPRDTRSPAVTSASASVPRRRLTPAPSSSIVLPREVPFPGAPATSTRSAEQRLDDPREWLR